jgi:hypothetical protein
VSGPRRLTLWNGSVAELITMTAVVVALPFYLGLIHIGIPLFVSYSAVAGAAMATGEFLEYSDVRYGLSVLLQGAAVWMAIVGSCGSLVYGLALLF